MAAESSKAGEKRAEMEVDELLKMLQLSEEEKDGVVLAKEDRENLPAVKWMAAAKLLTAKGVQRDLAGVHHAFGVEPSQGSDLSVNWQESVGCPGVLPGGLEAYYGGRPLDFHGIRIDA